MSGIPENRLVRVTAEGGVGVLSLADPEHRNTLSKQMSDDLAWAVDAALDDGARALVLTAEPPVFCAGGSLEGLLNRTVPLAEMYAGMERLAAAAVPTIAAVGGPAIGAGVNLPLACDVILASPAARFDPRFLDAGIHPGGGHLWRLAERVGAQGAAALVLCGDVLTGEEAADMGLAWRCVPEDRLESTALRLAGRAAERSAPLVRRAKQTLLAGRALSSPKEAAELELAAQEWSVGRPEFAESVRSIQRKLAERRDGSGTSHTPPRSP
ncbi:enoyl-CoA hydratase-related protein [Actinomadura rugatobispora]|uniref:Enoyl-CoA hydratase-related protein n=1 Tax=Actinomadura rugatobispora TaxID=1994 RepID=A0ABW0ZR05_9ACTN|nr:enoyl-CoA hydratase [Actinomadura rugatobispora]